MLSTVDIICCDRQDCKYRVHNMATMRKNGQYRTEYSELAHYHCPVKDCDYIYWPWDGGSGAADCMLQHNHCGFVYKNGESCHVTDELHVHCAICERPGLHNHCAECSEQERSWMTTPHCHCKECNTVVPFANKTICWKCDNAARQPKPAKASGLSGIFRRFAW